MWGGVYSKYSDTSEVAAAPMGMCSHRSGQDAGGGGKDAVHRLPDGCGDAGEAEPSHPSDDRVEGTGRPPRGWD